MNENAYHQYLLRRSLLSKIYRNYVLYPALAKQLQGKVLDIGCGIGDFLQFRPNTVGVDINKMNVDYCNSLGLQAFQIGNGKYPFSDGAFNGAILDNVLEHLTNPQATLEEAKRVLTPNGVFIIGVPGKKGYTMDDDHKKFYEENDLENLLKTFGFTLIKFVYGPAFIKSEFLSKSISQYCIYGVFRKNEVGNISSGKV
jgi:SAM-dependent methyltransferase